MKIGDIFLSWRKKEDSQSETLLQLDPTPSWEEEWRDFEIEDRLRGVPFDKESAKRRVDRIARRLAILWSAFLIYVILGQAFGSAPQVHTYWKWFPLSLYMAEFSLEPAEFIAVVTTTTASVFGFLVIVATHLFKGDK